MQRRAAGDRFVYKWLGPLLFFGSLPLILYFTLYDFRFWVRPLTLQEVAGGFVPWPSSVLDLPRNILLFMPFGFGLATLLSRRNWRSWAWVAVIGAAGFGLSLAIEWAQSYLPLRTPSLADLLGNTMGALAGLACFRLWENRTSWVRRATKVLTTTRSLAILMLLYLGLLVMVAATLGQSMRLRDWNETWPLLIGNERTGDRPWRGTISDLLIFDRALSATEIERLFANAPFDEPEIGAQVAHFALDGAEGLQDRTGSLPPLRWRGSGSPQFQSDAVQLRRKSWLSTGTAASALGQRLQNNSAFTIFFTAATVEAPQQGPARIVSFSTDTMQRNFTVGQSDYDLILRVKTPATGQNGAAPMLIFPNVFASPERQQLAVAFDGLSASLYQNGDDRPLTIELLPGIVLFRYLLLVDMLDLTVTEFTGPVLKLLAYALLFLPLGGLLALATKRWPAGKARTIFVLLFLLLTPVLIEALMVSGYDAHLRPANVILGAVILAAPLCWRLAAAAGQARRKR